MADLDSLIGSRLSLISQQDVRYDGTLFSINAAEASIALSNVKCLGTEERVVATFVPPSAEVLAFVTFPGSEIKDLYVHESNATASANIPSANTPPAPPSATQERKAEQPKQSRQPRQPRQQNDRKPQQPQNQSEKPPQPPSQVQQKNERRQPSASQGTGRGGSGRGNNYSGGREGNNNGGRGRGRSDVGGRGTGVSSSAGTGEHLLKLRQRGGGVPGKEADAGPVGDFDFSAGLSNFNKEEVLATVAETKEVEVKAETKYKKDDFFDMLSCDLLGQSNRLSGRDERALNQDTFGAVALQSNFSGYRRGGGGGYRGGARGGRRGGYGRGGGRGGRAPAAPAPSA